MLRDRDETETFLSRDRDETETSQKTSRDRLETETFKTETTSLSASAELLVSNGSPHHAPEIYVDVALLSQRGVTASARATRGRPITASRLPYGLNRFREIFPNTLVNNSTSECPW